MSLSPHQILGRLQELKKWQVTHEKMLKRSSYENDFEENSFNNPRSGNYSEIYQNTELDYSAKSVSDPDQIKLSPSPDGKDFTELLEKKLNEYKDQIISEGGDGKPKKPFLRKGSGLSKYNLKPEEYKRIIGSKYSNNVIIAKKRPKSVEISKKSPIIACERPKTSSVEKFSNTKKLIQHRPYSLNRTKPKNVNWKKFNSKPPIEHKKNEPKEDIKELKVPDLKHNNKESKILEKISKPIEKEKKNSPKLLSFLETITREKQSGEFTPLKVPDINIKTKGNWCDIDEKVDKSKINDKYCQKNSNDEEFLSDGIFTTTSPVLVQSKWQNSGQQQQQQVNGFRSSVNENSGFMWNLEENRQSESIPNTQNIVRKSLSYESNNNNNQSLYEKALETELMIFEALERKVDLSGYSSTNTSIIQLLSSTPSKFNLKNTAILERIIDTNEDFDNRPVRDKISEFENAEFQDEADDVTIVSNEAENSNENRIIAKKDSSVNTENFGMVGSIYSSSSCSETSENYFDDSETKGFSGFRQQSEENLNVSESCRHCGFLIRTKIEECQSELDCLKIEKNKIIAIKQKMDKEKKDFEKEMKDRRRQFEEQRLRLQLEIEEEKKKISELGKRHNEKSNKDVKMKIQLRKEKEEINNLKMELNETKEIMKMRETKNAMSIARLRNQVKILEKNNGELKIENEKLLKEKAKLVAQQKSQNKTVETKMLKEISKNISKLTEETFKNQNFKNETSSSEEETKIRKSSKGKGDFKDVKTPDINKIKNIGYGEQFEDSNVEEIYKSLFGGQELVIIDEENNTKDESFPKVVRCTGLEKTENILEDGTKEIKYSNGNKKLISENGTIRYYYSSNDTWHTNFPDGTEVIEFPNGQSEQRFKDGKCLIFFPDGLIQTIFPDGSEEVKYPDGSKLLTKKDGERMLFLSNGQVEIHTKDEKRREYPDGTVKILYPDGAQETRYSNGRVRMKNSKGDVVLDTGGGEDDRI